MKQKQIDRIRAFNRFYTKILGILNRHYMGSSFGLPEIRVIQDMYLHPGRGAKEIALELNMDKGYLSRLLKKLEEQGYVCRSASDTDGRRDIISLTDSGIVIYHELNASADRSVEDIYGGLTEERMKEMIAHMDAISNLLANDK